MRNLQALSQHSESSGKGEGSEKGEEQLSDNMFKIVQQLQVSQLEHSKQMSI